MQFILAQPKTIYYNIYVLQTGPRGNHVFPQLPLCRQKSYCDTQHGGMKNVIRIYTKTTHPG